MASRRHLVTVWNPVHGPNVMELHLDTLLSFVQAYRAGECDEDDVYVWWGDMRSSRRRRPIAHLDDVLAIETEDNRNAPGPETHLYLTDYRSLYVAHVGEVTAEDVRNTDPEHTPDYYRKVRVDPDCWFLLWDIRRLVADDTVSVVNELAKLRNTRDGDEPVSIYEGMVELPLIVTDATEDRYFDADIRDQATDGRFWAEFDAERVGVGAMERELRENLLGDEAWRGIEPAARSFIATAEKVYRDHVAEPAFDFAAVIIEYSKALEIHCNALLRKTLARAPAELRWLNVDGSTVDLTRGEPLSLTLFGRVIGHEQKICHYLRGHLTHGDWFIAAIPGILSDFAKTRNAGAHSRRVQRDEASLWRSRLLGIGCQGYLASLGGVGPVTF